jgi:hypothetical protein
MSSPRSALPAATCLVAVLAGCGSQATRSPDAPPTSHAVAGLSQQEYQRYVKANYKPLDLAQSQRLLRLGRGIRACLAQSFAVGPLKVLPTRIQFSVQAAPRAVAQADVSCVQKTGPPPADASLQVRGHLVLLYLPKYCILDTKVLGQDRSARR